MRAEYIVLEIDDLKAGYGPVRILSGVSLTVRAGQVVALLGGNGTGKSTLLKTVSGLVKPQEGAVVFNGERIDGLRPDLIVRRGLVQVTQGKEAFPGMTVEENLLVGAFSLTGSSAVRRSLEQVYEYFPVLREKRVQRANVLSGGQLQMLCIGRGLMSNPKMILLDEPSAALAPKITLDIFLAINRICQEGMTVLLVEQNVRMALLLADYGYVIRDGVVHLEGNADDLVNDERVRMSYLGGTVVSETENHKLMH